MKKKKNLCIQAGSGRILWSYLKTQFNLEPKGATRKTQKWKIYFMLGFTEVSIKS